jgi:catechol 2,3-dioxygenase-like lactoylglutathione lyase family enzyme
MHQANPINVRAIDHVVLRVADLERMIGFYCDVLGLRLERGPGELKLAQLRAGSALIDLIDIDGPLGAPGGGPPAHDAPNVDHICLQVAPWDGEAIIAHLTAKGVDAGEIGTRYGADGMGPSIYINDPEGNGIELKGL